MVRPMVSYHFNIACSVLCDPETTWIGGPPVCGWEWGTTGQIVRTGESWKGPSRTKANRAANQSKDEGREICDAHTSSYVYVLFVLIARLNSSCARYDGIMFAMMSRYYDYHDVKPELHVKFQVSRYDSCMIS